MTNRCIPNLDIYKWTEIPYHHQVLGFKKRLYDSASTLQYRTTWN